MIFDYYHVYPVGYRVDYVKRDGSLASKKYNFRRDLAELFCVKCELNNMPSRLVTVLSNGSEQLFSYGCDLIKRFDIA